MLKNENVYIVSSFRSAVTKANRGAFKNFRPDNLLANIIQGTVAKTPNLDPNTVDEAIFGCAMPEGTQGMNIARIATLLAGLPQQTPAMTVNRFCCSGIESMALIAARIQAGEIECGIAGGIESMSQVPMGGHHISANPKVFESDENIGIAYGMGLTAEVVAERYKIDRASQDTFALHSHEKALKAQSQRQFAEEILPINVDYHQYDPSKADVKTATRTIGTDEGPRSSTLEGLAKLKPAFDAKGSVTAGNSSQVSDGAGCAILVSESFLKKHNLTPLARFVSYQVAGVPPEIMGIGPIEAIPKVLKKANLNLSDIHWIELNEAFAAQSLAVIRTLNLDESKVNPNGGAIALGHPLGATGAIRVATAIHGCQKMKITGPKYAIITMCIGIGMGAAGILEIL